MSEPYVIKTIEEFRAFVEKNGISELVARDAKKKYKTFFKFSFNEIQQSEGKEAAEKVLDAIKNNSEVLKNGIGKLDNLAKFQQLGLVLNGMNLCATCVGFAIMYKKLDDMSASIEQQIGEVKQIVEKGNDVQLNYKFNDVLEEHMDMLDCRKKQKPYSEEKMRELVSRESVILNYLIDVLNYDISSNKEALIFSLMSMGLMFTASLKYYDEIYYFNYKDLHSSHDHWMEVYTKLYSEPVVKKVQEYGFLDMGLNTVLTDELYISFEDQAKELEQEVNDNLKLLKLIGNEEDYKAFSDFSSQAVKEELENAFKEAFEKDPNTKKVYENAVNQVCQIA